MLEKAALSIGEYETFGSVYNRLMPLGAELIVSTLSKIKKGTIIKHLRITVRPTTHPP